MTKHKKLLFALALVWFLYGRDTSTGGQWMLLGIFPSEYTCLVAGDALLLELSPEARTMCLEKHRL